MATGEHHESGKRTAEMTAAELEKIHAEVSKMISETMKLNAETLKIQSESRWYPFIAGAAFFAAAAAFVKLFL